MQNRQTTATKLKAITTFAFVRVDNISYGPNCRRSQYTLWRHTTIRPYSELGWSEPRNHINWRAALSLWLMTFSNQKQIRSYISKLWSRFKNSWSHSGPETKKILNHIAIFTCKCMTMYRRFSVFITIKAREYLSVLYSKILTLSIWCERVSRLCL